MSARVAFNWRSLGPMVANAEKISPAVDVDVDATCPDATEQLGNHPLELDLVAHEVVGSEVPVRFRRPRQQRPEFRVGKARGTVVASGFSRTSRLAVARRYVR